MSWFTSIFIAVIAAPLWAIMHATPGGDEHFGKGADGYILLMSVVLRPSLTILAMIGAYGIIYAISKIISTGYFTAFQSAQMTSVVGLIGFLVGLLMYATFTLTVIYGCFRLVQTVPDAILKWIGGRDDDSIGVESHSDKNVGMVMSIGNRVGPKNLGKPGRTGDKTKDIGNQVDAAQSESTNKDLSAGATSASESTKQDKPL